MTCTIARAEEAMPSGEHELLYTPSEYLNNRGIAPVLLDAVFDPTLDEQDSSTGSESRIRIGEHVVLPAASVRRPERSSVVRFHRNATVRGLDDARLCKALDDAERVDDLLTGLVGRLPPDVAGRLGFVRDRPPYSWADALFHLEWHFPTFGQATERLRIHHPLTSGRPGRAWPEYKVQLGLFKSDDRYEGVIVSRLHRDTDFMSATITALKLIKTAVDGLERCRLTRPHATFEELHHQFSKAAQSSLTRPRLVQVTLLRLPDLRQTCAAEEGTNLSLDADQWGVPCPLVLSHWNSDRVVCVLRGPALDEFLELADRAGTHLPVWP